MTSQNCHRRATAQIPRLIFLSLLMEDQCLDLRVARDPESGHCINSVHADSCCFAFTAGIVNSGLVEGTKTVYTSSGYENAEESQKSMFSPRKFWSYCWGTIFRPASTLKKLAFEGSLSYSFAAYFLFGLLYSVFVLILYLNGVVPSGILVSAIPEKQYYLWEAIFMVPISMLSYVLFAAVAHFLSRLQGGKGGFKSTLAVFGFTYSIPLIVLFWFPDVILFFLVGREKWLNLVPFYGAAVSLWTFFLSVAGLRTVQQTSLIRTSIVVFVAILIGNALTIVLIR